MKHLITFLSTIFFTCPSIHSQSNDCNVPYNNYYDFQYLEANAIRTPIYNRGDLFHDKPGERYPLAQFVVPYEKEIEVQSATIFAGGLWLGGYTSDDKLKLAATTYGWVSDNYDYQAGPLDSMGNASQISCKYYGKVWKVKGIIIEQFLADFKDNGRIDNPIPRSIKYWPARSNGNLEYPMDIELAPFFDRNRNNKYEPEKGDYPIIGEGFEKVVPTELIWCVFNTNGDFHATSLGEPFPLEIQLTTWAFDCEANDLLHHSIFTRYKIINKSEETLERMRIGLWMDADIGCHEDDYFGSDSLLNTSYFYNADNDDEAGAPYRYCGLPNVYGENPPVHSMTFLNQSLDFVTYYMITIGHLPADMVAPNRPKEFYHYLDGKWGGGVPLTTGGFGYQTGSPTRYAFHDNPNQEDGWSMYQVGLDSQEDEQVVSTTAQDSLESNASFTLDIAHTFHRKKGYNHLENVDYALERIPNLQEAYNEGFENICLISTTEEMERGSFEYQVYPNPASQHFQLRLPLGFQDQSLQIKIYDLNGKELFETTKRVEHELKLAFPDDLVNGIYVLEISTAHQSFMTKIVKASY